MHGWHGSEVPIAIEVSDFSLHASRTFHQQDACGGPMVSVTTSLVQAVPYVSEVRVVGHAVGH